MADDLQTLPIPARVASRPLLDRWIFEQRSNYSAFAVRIGVSREAVRFWCLPFGDAGRWAPSTANRDRIAEVTAGAVPPWSFDDTPEAREAFFTPPGAGR